MIVRITNHPRQVGIVLVHTPPELAHDVMGPFQPARWSKPTGAYLLGVEHLDTFARHLARHDVHLVDERDTASGDGREKFTGPLPECASCGQPARRGDPFAFCPACGRPWQPANHSRADPVATHAQCASCDRHQAGGFTHCSACGGLMVRVVTGRRPALARPKLEEPALFGDLVADVAAGLEPDHMQRAAGDR